MVAMVNCYIWPSLLFQFTLFLPVSLCYFLNTLYCCLFNCTLIYHILLLSVTLFIAIFPLRFLLLSVHHTFSFYLSIILSLTICLSNSLLLSIHFMHSLFQSICIILNTLFLSIFQKCPLLVKQKKWPLYTGVLFK